MRALVTPGNIPYLYVMQRLTTLLLLAGTAFTVQAQTDCGLPHDINNNGSVDIEDFLSILGLFGDQDNDGDGVYDSQDNCFDLTSCNYMEVNAEFCSYPDAIGDCNGNCPLDEDGDGVCDLFSCGASVSYQGYDYATVLIGDQCWFAENLRNENYQNGDEILSDLSDSEWQGSGSGAVAVYGEDSGCSNYSSDIDACDPAQSLAKYGRLYNWFAVSDTRGLCPSGWHVPTDEEWMITEIALGMSAAEANELDWRGTDQGAKLKASPFDALSWDGTNSSGFSAVPGGSRGENGFFYNGGLLGAWWTSTVVSSPHAMARILRSEFEEIDRWYWHMRNGHSVRCIQDSEE